MAGHPKPTALDTLRALLEEHGRDYRVVAIGLGPTLKALYDAIGELDERTARYRPALVGISSCATRCECCEMHVGIAREALQPVAADPAGRL